MEKETLDRVKKYLNDVINNEAPSQAEADIQLLKDIQKLEKDKAKDIAEKYIDIAYMLRQTYGLYRRNIEYFERRVLQLNSVISTTLMLEYRIHDRIYNKDLLLEGNQKEIKNPNFFYKYVIELLSRLDAEEDHTEETKQQIQKLIKEAKDLKADAEKQAEKTQNQINNFRENEYYIYNFSRDNNLISLFKTLFKYCLANEILTGIREAYFKEYDIKEKNRLPKAKRLHCLKQEAYKITTKKLAEIINLSILDAQNPYSKEPIIEKNSLQVFTIFMNLAEEIEKEKFKKLLEKETSNFFKKLENATSKLDYLAIFIDTEADNLLQETRWLSFEK